MRDRDRQRFPKPESVSARRGTTMKCDDRLTCASAADLDLAPPDSANTETEHLRDGLFGRPTTGEMENVRAAIHLLPFRVHAIQKAAGVPLQYVADPRRLNDVDANLGGIAHARTPRTARRVARGSGGRARRAGAPGR